MESAGATTIALQGNFDASAVSRLRELLAQASPEAALTLDLSKVREVEWCALATLAAALAELPAIRVSVTGYSYQHARLLAYLGFDVSAAASAPAAG